MSSYINKRKKKRKTKEHNEKQIALVLLLRITFFLTHPMHTGQELEKNVSFSNYCEKSHKNTTCFSSD